MLRKTILAFVLTTLAAHAPIGAQTVPGTSNPWLAGMPSGTVAGGFDSAPTNSPVLFTGFSLFDGQILTISATGLVAHGPAQLLQAPDGATGAIVQGTFAPENGMANVTAPINALMGVFLGATQPDLSATPGSLDFSTGASRDFLSLAPLLKQVFFIGDGLTSGSAVQQFFVPTGATRLYFGTMDGFGWFNNIGAFNVTVAEVSVVPEPGSGVLLAAGLVGALFAARRRT